MMFITKKETERECEEELVQCRERYFTERKSFMFPASSFGFPPVTFLVLRQQLLFAACTSR